jgi:DNA-binding MarR family transcriptional regulator
MIQVERESGKALVRTMHLSEVQAAGAARAAALHEADVQIDRIARVLPAALASGLSVAELSRSAGVSRQTIYELKGRYGSDDDLELAAMQVLVTRAPLTLEELAELVGRDVSEVGPIVDALVDAKSARWSVREEPELGEVNVLYLTENGRTLLQYWWMQDDVDAEPS